MMKKIKNIWGIIEYPILYVLMQVIISVIFMAYYNLKSIDRISLQEFIKLFKNISKNYDDFLKRYMVIILLVNFVVVFIICFNEIVKNRKINFNKVPMNKVFLLIFTAIFWQNTYMLIFGFIAQFTKLKEVLGKRLLDYQNMLQYFSGDLLLSFIAIGIGAPIIEEIIFRGITYSRLKKLTSVKWAIIIQAALFGLIHANLVQGIFGFVYGILLALVYEYFKSIYASMIMHSVSNSISFLYMSITKTNMFVMGAFGLFILISPILFILCWLQIRKS